MIDLTRKEAHIDSRVPESISSKGYDLDRVPEREARQGVAGRLVRIELKSANPYIVWPNFQQVLTIANLVPPAIRPYLGKDEGALLSVLDYCDVLSLALNGVADTVKRVQHPKKWQPGEVDGLYYSDYSSSSVLYPVEAKALSTGDNVNLAQVEGAYRTTIRKIADVKIVPLAVQMTASGMYIAVFKATDQHSLVIVDYHQIILDPPLATWQAGKRGTTPLQNP